MNSQVTADSSQHSTSNAVAHPLSTQEGYLKRAMFLIKLHFFLRVQIQPQLLKIDSTQENEAEATHLSDQTQLHEADPLTSDSNTHLNVLEQALISYSQRAINSQQTLMESNILKYEEDLDYALMLESYIRFANSTSSSFSSPLSNLQPSQQPESIKDSKCLPLLSSIRSVVQARRTVAIEASTKLMEALLQYRKNLRFYDAYQNVVSQLTQKICSTQHEQLSKFFALTAKAIMLTKSAHKGVLMLKLMHELGLKISADAHLNPVLEGCFRSGKHHFIQEAFLNAKALDQDSLESSTLKVVVKYFSKLGQTQLAFSYFKTLQKKAEYLEDPHAYQSLDYLLEALLKADALEEAEMLYAQAYNQGKERPGQVDVMTFSSMIKGYCKAQRLNEALQVLAQMRQLNIKPDEVLYNSLLDGCSKNNQLSQAFEIYRQMLSPIDEQGTLINPSTITFNTLIDCCVRCNSLEKAWQVYEDMQARGVKADNYTYSTLFKGIRHEGQKHDLDRAFLLYNSFSTSDSFTPDEILFNVLLDACINCKQLDRAVELFKQLKYQQPHQPLITEAEDEIILQIPTTHQQQRHSNFIRPDEISFNTIIKGCAQERKLGLAFEMFSMMKQTGLRPNDVTYNSIIDACVRCNKMHSAWSLLSEMQANQITPDNFTYSTLIKGIRAENNSQQAGAISNPQELERAFSLLEVMKQNGQVRPDEILYNCLIDACVRFHDVNRAVAVFHEMQLSGIKPSSVTYGILIKAYGQANQLENAFFVFKRMKESQLVPNSVTYGCLIDACVKNNQVDRAMEVFETMKRDGVPLNTIIFTTLIKGFAKSHKLIEALEVYQTMKSSDDKVRPNNVTFNSLIDCCIRCGSIQKAQLIFEEMKQGAAGGTRPDLITYSTMIKGFCREKNIHQALTLLNEMEREGILADEVLYNSLLDGCCKAGEVELALKVFKNMEILKIKPSNVTYSILVKIYGKQRNLPKALAILEDMKRESIKPGLIVYTCLLQTCIKSKQIKTAEQLYHDMRVQGIRGDQLTYQTMLNGCLQFQKFDTVLQLLKDAQDQRIQLSQELTQSILNELNRWHTPEDPHLKQDITQKVLAYIDLFNNKGHGGVTAFSSSGQGAYRNYNNHSSNHNGQGSNFNRNFANNSGNGGLSGDSKPFYASNKSQQHHSQVASGQSFVSNQTQSFSSNIGATISQEEQENIRRNSQQIAKQSMTQNLLSTFVPNSNGSAKNGAPSHHQHSDCSNQKRGFYNSSRQQHNIGSSIKASQQTPGSGGFLGSTDSAGQLNFSSQEQTRLTPEGGANHSGPAQTEVSAFNIPSESVCSGSAIQNSTTSQSMLQQLSQQQQYSELESEESQFHTQKFKGNKHHQNQSYSQSHYKNNQKSAHNSNTNFSNGQNRQGKSFNNQSQDNTYSGPGGYGGHRQVYDHNNSSKQHSASSHNYNQSKGSYYQQDERYDGHYYSNDKYYDQYEEEGYYHNNNNQSYYGGSNSTSNRDRKFEQNHYQNYQGKRHQQSYQNSSSYQSHSSSFNDKENYNPNYNNSNRNQHQHQNKKPQHNYGGAHHNQHKHSSNY